MGNLAILGEYRALESALWREIERIKGSDPLAPVVVVAPTGRLVRRLKAEGARRFPRGLLGVRFTNLFRFALDLAEVEFRSEPILAERILLRWLKERPLNAPTTYDLAAAMRGAIRDLKDAAVGADPRPLIERLKEAVEEEARGEYDNRLTAYDIRKFGDLLGSFVHYEAEMRRLGVSDLPDIFRAAEKRARLEAPLLVYGFYDVTQVQADFLEAVARRTPTTLFIPSGDGETWKFGDWFRQTLAPRIAERTEHVRSDPPLEPAIRNAAGERDEVYGCAKEIRRRIDEGVPPTEIALVARTLDPYLPHIEEIFRDHHFPVATLPGRPVGEHPLSKAVRQLFRARLDDHPRVAVLDAILHPLFEAGPDRRHWDYLVRALRIGRGADWDRLRKFTRKGYRVRSGRESEDDLRVLSIRPAEVRELQKAVRTVREDDRPDEAGWREMSAAHFRRLALFDRKSAEPEEKGVLEEISGILRRLGDLHVLGEKVRLPEFLDAFDREMDRARLPRPSANGVAVLDAMGLRGLSFRHVFAVGLNSRTFPRFIVEEPFISDAVRRNVLRVPGHHLPVRRDGYDEERLLFHLVRGAATEGLVCYYQRADAEGRQKDPSPFLRPYLGDRGKIRSVPRGFRSKLAGETLLTRRERVLFSEDRERWLTVFGWDTTAFQRARKVFESLHAAKPGEFEGLTGRTRTFQEFSPTRLERYRTCPFQYFASDVLRLFPYDEADEGDDLNPLEIGSLEHLMLEKLYRNLAERKFRDYDLEKEVERAARDAGREFEAGTHIALTGLLAARRDQAARAVRAFAEWDLAHLGDWEPVEFEKRGEAGFADVRFRGMVDRVDRGPGEARRVVDYKRRYRHSWDTKLATQAQRGEKLQAPLYLEFSGAQEAVFLFIEDHLTCDPAVRDVTKTLRREEWDDVRADVERAVRVLVASMRKGYFAIRPKEGEHGHCRYCDYGSVCRRQYRWLARKAEESGEEYWEIVKPKRRS